MVHHIVNDVYKLVIVASQFDQAIGDLELLAVSNLWDDVSGYVTIAWYDWAEKVSLNYKNNMESTPRRFSS
jgi:hypothetical protein